MKHSYEYHGSEIAVIGMSAKFPGADNIEEFWKNLCSQKESISSFSNAELEAAGVSGSLLGDSSYVKSKGIVNGSNDFDAEFFDYSDREAAIMDPQLRLYHECAWHALEDAGYSNNQNNSKNLIGVFGGASANALWVSQFAEIAERGGAEAYELINVISRDFFNSRLAYKLNLKGPVVTVQTACSTAMVAVHQACQSLLSGDSDISLAGAVSLSLNPSLKQPELQGYMYQEGMILSPDGRCRPFDQSAQGTVLSDGVGFVVLKRLHDAIEDNDRIYAVIKGSAVNNDGNDKIGYTAPSVKGQSEVIQSALSIAGVQPSSIGYIEAHGTGTSLGDPIEVQALLEAYEGFETSPCYLGSVKSNIGHLDTAAGIAGFIKSILAVKNGIIPATLNFNELNHKCNIKSSSLSVAKENHSWESDSPLRAGVSSFGIGGTNAHVIIEEYLTPKSQSSDSRCISILPLSAKSKSSLKNYEERIRASLNGESSASDMAFTLSERRREFDVRKALVVDADNTVLYSSFSDYKKSHTNIYLMFSGQGTQYALMGKGLYHEDKVFRNSVDECLKYIDEQDGPNIRNLIIGDEASEAVELQLRSTEKAQLCLFVVEYSMAMLIRSLGVKPKGMIGHSLGEYVAACIAGVFSLQHAISLVIARGRLMASTDKGAMLAIHQPLEAFNLDSWSNLSLAAINTGNSFVLSGPETEISRLKEFLKGSEIEFTPLHTSHGFHSKLMEPIFEEFRAVLESTPLNPPKIPIVSNVTGDWIDSKKMINPEYWLTHLRKEVRFSEGLGKILSDDTAMLIELGPGKTLCSFARQNSAYSRQHTVINTLRSAKESEPDILGVKRVTAELFANGVSIDWKECNKGKGQLVSLPGYAFDHKTYLPNFSGFKSKQNSSREGIYEELWVKHNHEEILIEDPSAFSKSSSDNVILVFREGCEDEQALLDELRHKGNSLIEVYTGNIFRINDESNYQIRPEIKEDYVSLLREIGRIPVSFNKILMLWQTRSEDLRYRSFSALLYITQVLSELNFTKDMSIYTVVEGAYLVNGDEDLYPANAIAYGPVRVISQEYSNIQCHLLDIKRQSQSRQASILAKALSSKDLPIVTAWRGDTLWIREFQHRSEQWQAKKVHEGFKYQGVYVITGAFGGLGREIARHLSSQYKARLVLSSRANQSGNILINELKEMGGHAVLAQLDLKEPKAIDVLFEKATSSFGEINGVIHCAGLPGDTMIQRQDIENAALVIDTKVKPAVRIIELCEKYELDQVIFFSSVTGILGGYGQIDYCSANAVLDALAEDARRLGTKNVYSIRWDAWRETGMAFDAFNGKLKTLEHSGHPFIGALIRKDESTFIYRKEVTVNNCWALNEHIVMGVPTIPGSTYLEMAGAVFSNATGIHTKEFSDVYFLSPMSLKEEDSADLYTILEKDGVSYSFEIGSFNHNTQQWLLHARGCIDEARDSAGLNISLSSLRNNGNARYLNNIESAAHLGLLATGKSSLEEQNAFMKYGDRWSVVKEVWVFENSGLARLQLPAEFSVDFEKMRLHPSMLDCALSFLRIFIDEGVYIPISYQRLTQYSALPEEFYSIVHLSSSTDKKLGVMSFDIQLLDESGEVLVNITDFSMRRIDSSFLKNKVAEKTAQIPQFVHRYKPMDQGLSNAKGIKALENVIQSSWYLPIVTASDFSDRLASADHGDTSLFEANDKGYTELRPRPDLNTEYTAPKTDRQKQISKIWQEMLGFEKIGIHDDFFELGGDSLLLMQIHKKIQSSINKKVPIVEMYNHPSIEKFTYFLSSQENGNVDKALTEVVGRMEKKKAAAARRRKRKPVIEAE